MKMTRVCLFKYLSKVRFTIDLRRTKVAVIFGRCGASQHPNELLFAALSSVKCCCGDLQMRMYVSHTHTHRIL